MKGNFSRFTFNRRKHYSGVLLQQGRVQLDADWNEQLDIASHLRRRAVTDLLGAAGAPAAGGGFGITVEGGEIRIGAGDFWLDGLLVENDADTDINSQPFPPGIVVPTAPDGNFLADLYVAYLDVWERHITALEDPELLEPALGGPDTATRRQTVWQVKLQPTSQDTACADLTGFNPLGTVVSPTLAARTVGAVESNRLYRVEVHRGSGDPNGPTFKWSRDNGAFAARIENPAQLEIVLLAQLEQDAAEGFAAGEWVEVTDEERMLRGEPGTFARLAAVSGQRLTVEGWPDPNDPVPDLGTNPIVRRWDNQPESDEPITVPVDNDGYLPLEGGLEIKFGSIGAQYTTGDYWLVPVRAQAGVLWPTEATGEPLFQPPDGVEHHYVSLALLRLDVPAAGAETGWSLIEPCRKVFQPLGEVQGDKVDVTGDRMTGPLLIDEASLAVRAGGANAFKVTDTGRVGIGPGAEQPEALLQVKGGAVMPEVGNSESAGILFPRDAFDGSGDRAWIRYYSRGGEKTTLEIGIANDPDDHIALMPSGNVGIGTNNPQAKLDVAGPVRLSGSGALLFHNTSASGLPTGDGFRMRYENNFFGTNKDALVIEKTDGNDADPDGGIAFVNTGNDGVFEPALVIRGDGKVGVGTFGPETSLQVARGQIMPAAGTEGGIAFPRDPGGGGGDQAWIRYYSRGGERMLLELRIQNDGPGVFADDIALMPSSRVGIKTTEPGSELDVVGLVRANNFTLRSDQRWKKEIRTLEGALAAIEALRGVRFEFRTEEFPDLSLTPGEQIGLVAQEVEEVLPQLVTTTDDGFKNLAYANLTAVLVEAVKELSSRCRALEARLPGGGPAAGEVAS
jgi:hypothetical protein